MMPWEYIDEVYAKNMSSETGRSAISSRIAFGAIFIKEFLNLTDEGTVEAIQENPYLQYFLGLLEFQDEPLFDSSMMVYFRKRFPVNEVARINEYFCSGKRPEGMRDVDRNHAAEHNDEENVSSLTEETEGTTAESEGTAAVGEPDTETSESKSDESNGKDNQQRKTRGRKGKAGKKPKSKKKKNRGKLIIDATVAPADIKFPTDVDLLNQCREILEKAINILWPFIPHDHHKLPYSAKVARKLYLKLAKSKKWAKTKVRSTIKELLRYVELATERLEAMLLLIEHPEKHLANWILDRLSVIPLVYRQQKQMYDENTNICENRIVSLEQPHVRPIKRGKRPNPTEFGQKLHLSTVNGFTYLEQTSWSNFNESLDLKEAVENYYRREGYYPCAVLADQIYQTRANKAYCKERGIRLSGLPLGRRKTSDTEAKVKRQMYKDACERNAIESRNGVVKRRFGLNCIMSKLDENAKTEAALNILAMNASYRLAQWLALFWQYSHFYLRICVFQ